MKKSIISKVLFSALLLLTSSSVFAATSYYYEESTSGWATILALISFFAAFLQIILFFKIWIMTKNVEEIHDQYMTKELDFTDAKLPYIFNRKDEAYNILNQCMEKHIKTWIETEKKQILIDRDIQKIEKNYYEAIGMEMPAEYKEFKIEQYVNLFNKYKKATQTSETADKSQASNSSQA